jgi:hypothetical protein
MLLLLRTSTILLPVCIHDFACMLGDDSTRENGGRVVPCALLSCGDGATTTYYNQSAS